MVSNHLFQAKKLPITGCNAGRLYNNWSHLFRIFSHKFTTKAFYSVQIYFSLFSFISRAKIVTLTTNC